MMRIIPFDFAHVDIFEQTDYDIENFGKMDSKSPNALAEYGMGFTGIYDGRILIMGGVLQQSEKSARGWTMISKYASQYGVKVFFQTKALIENIMDDMKLHRLETANLASADQQHKWCELLGFVKEGEMPYYDDKKRTYIRFAKLRG